MLIRPILSACWQLMELGQAPSTQRDPESEAPSLLMVKFQRNVFQFLEENTTAWWEIQPKETKEEFTIANPFWKVTRSLSPGVGLNKHQILLEALSFLRRTLYEGLGHPSHAVLSCWKLVLFLSLLMWEECEWIKSFVLSICSFCRAMSKPS